MRPAEIDYSSRARHYIDLSNGEILAGKAAVKEYISLTTDSDHLHELGALLRQPVNELPDIDLPKLNTKDWPRERYIECGRWLARAATAPTKSKERQLNRLIFDNARRLGVGPSRWAIEHEFGCYSNLYAEIKTIDAHALGVSDSWSLSDHLKFIRKIGGDYRPSAADFNQLARENTTYPSAEAMRKRFKRIGGFVKLLELAGYPVIDLWNRDDYIDWGIKFMQANGGMVPSLHATNYLSTKKRGPSCTSIRNHFSALGKFQREVVRNFGLRSKEEAEATNEKLTTIANELKSNKVPLAIFLSTASNTEDQDSAAASFNEAEIDDFVNLQEPRFIIRRFAQYRVVRSLVPEISEEVLIKNIREEISPGRIIRKYRSISDGDIEYAALTLGYFDYLWPMDDHLESLKLDEGYEKYHKEQKQKDQIRNSRRDRGKRIILTP